jgi:hypothetical protein
MMTKAIRRKKIHQKKKTIILYIKANIVVSVCLCGQKLGNAWKILLVIACSLWSWSIVDGKIG